MSHLGHPGTGGAPPLGVVLCEDEASLRELVRYGLEQDGRLRVLAEVATAEECLDAVGAWRPGAVLVDLSLPGMDGLDAIPMLRAIDPELRIVVFSGLDAAKMEPVALERGADAYVEKGKSLSALRETLLAR